MAIPHLKSGERIDLIVGTGLHEAKTTTLFKTNDLEVIRLILPAGKEIPAHQAPGEITVQCLEGNVLFTAHGQENELTDGQFLCLSAAEKHSLKAVKNSSLLLTIVLKK